MQKKNVESVPPLLQRLAGKLDAAGGVVVIIMVCIGVIGFVWRYVFGQPLAWTDEMIAYCIPVFVMLCAGELFIGDRNIAIEIFPPVPLVKELSLFLASLLLFVSGISLVVFAVDFGMYMPGVLELPAWLVEICLPMGAAFMTVITGHQLLLALKKCRTGKDHAD